MRAWILIPFFLGFALLAIVSFQRHDAERRDLAMHQKRLAMAKRARASGGPSASGPGRRIKPVTLSGPGGSVKIPASRAMVVNVWLQACPDCMPRFNAARALVQSGESWPTPIVNVAYGRADPTWAARYGVDQGLVIDRGSAVVNPLGIRTFTTLVVDRDGKVVHTDYVDRPGFLKRVEAALAQADAPPAPKPPALNGPAGVPQVTPTPTLPPLPPPPAPQPSILEDKRALLGIGLMVLGVLGGLFELLRASAGGSQGSAGGPLQDWQEDLVVSGRRCASCAGRFDEPSETSRCGACEAPYHRSCARRERTCCTDSCRKRL
jgi:hypothetical protein